MSFSYNIQFLFGKNSCGTLGFIISFLVSDYIYLPPNVEILDPSLDVTRNFRSVRDWGTEFKVRVMEWNFNKNTEMQIVFFWKSHFWKARDIFMGKLSEDNFFVTDRNLWSCWRVKSKRPKENDPGQNMNRPNPEHTGLSRPIWLVPPSRKFISIISCPTNPSNSVLGFAFLTCLAHHKRVF